MQLNVGGRLFSTALSTLRKHPDSKLAELFTGQPKLCADARGGYFIDRDATHFGAVLEFLRSEQLPADHIQEVRVTPLQETQGAQGAFLICVCVCVKVYKEAVYYNIKPLMKRLEETPQMFGELVGRQQFLSRVPHYRENIEVS